MKTPVTGSAVLPWTSPAQAFPLGRANNSEGTAVIKTLTKRRHYCNRSSFSKRFVFRKITTSKNEKKEKTHWNKGENVLIFSTHLEPLTKLKSGRLKYSSMYHPSFKMKTRSWIGLFQLCKHVSLVLVHSFLCLAVSSRKSQAFRQRLRRRTDRGSFERNKPKRPRIVSEILMLNTNISTSCSRIRYTPLKKIL